VVPKTKESENAFSTGCQTSDNKINSSASLEESVINVGVVLTSGGVFGTTWGSRRFLGMCCRWHGLGVIL